jgi:hypothetical protein
VCGKFALGGRLSVKELTVLDLSQALVSDNLFLFEIAHERNERIQCISELTCEAKNLLDDGASVALTDSIGSESHEFTGQI